MAVCLLLTAVHEIQHLLAGASTGGPPFQSPRRPRRPLLVGRHLNRSVPLCLAVYPRENVPL